MLNQKNWRFYLLPLLVIFILGLALSGCGTDQGAVETPEEEAPEDVEVITLDFASPFPAPHPIHVHVVEPWIEEVQELAGGRLVINFYPGGALSESTAVVDDVATGAVDLGITMQAYTPGRFPLTDMIRFPAHYLTTQETATTLWTLYQENADFQNEYAAYKVFALFTTPEGNVYTVNKPVRTVADFPGLDLRVSGQMEEKTIAALGALASLIPMPETYDALERGVVDGLLTDHAAIDTYNLHEVLNYGTDGLNFMHAAKVIFMNKATWDALPAEVQAAFEEASGGIDLSMRGADQYAKMAGDARQVMADAGMELIPWGEAEKAELLAIAEPLITEYLDSLVAQGLPAYEVYEHMLQIRDSNR